MSLYIALCGATYIIGHRRSVVGISPLQRYTTRRQDRSIPTTILLSASSINPELSSCGFKLSFQSIIHRNGKCAQRQAQREGDRRQAWYRTYSTTHYYSRVQSTDPLGLHFSLHSAAPEASKSQSHLNASKLYRRGQPLDDRGAAVQDSAP